MHKIFTANPKELLDIVRKLTDEKFTSVERVLADKSKQAQLSIDVSRETNHRHGRVFSVTANLIARSKRYTASASEETPEQAIDIVRDDILRQVRKSQGKAMRILRKGGAKVKMLLRFGRSTK